MSIPTSLKIVLDFPINSNSVQRHFFVNPLKIIKARDFNEIDTALSEIENESKSGMFAVGFMAYDNALTGYHLLFGIFNHPTLYNPFPVESIPEFKSPWLLDEDIEDYKEKIGRIKNHIKSGDCYQVNYTIRAKNKLVKGNSWDLYLYLLDHQAARYSAYIECDEFSLLSFSPELFFCQKNTQLITKPMKGTSTIDVHLPLSEQINNLKNSDKDRAENLMIVDLLRNDLSKISRLGTVKTSKLFEVETYQDILQMTSTIEAELYNNTSFKDIINSLFPCGSITGAPKKIVKDIIQSIEKTSRGPYCGTIGYVSPNNTKEFNVAIRTIFHNKLNNQLIYGVGSGITWDSIAQDEYQEIINKVKFLTTNQPISLFETVFIHHGQCLLWDKHFARLKRSSEILGFSIPTDDHYQSLENCSEELKSVSCRGKYIYHKNGVGRWEFFPLPTLLSTYEVKITSHLVHSTDQRLHHKTTDRSVYDDAMARENGSLFDVILRNERLEITEFTKGNLVVEMDNEFFTPPLTCGLLAGIFRETLLEHKIIKEKILYQEDIYKADQVWFINSLRGWVKVKVKQPINNNNIRAAINE